MCIVPSTCTLISDMACVNKDLSVFTAIHFYSWLEWVYGRKPSLPHINELKSGKSLQKLVKQLLTTSHSSQYKNKNLWIINQLSLTILNK